MYTEIGRGYSSEKKGNSMRTVTVDLIVRTEMIIDDGVGVDEIVSELEYSFTDTTSQATICDTEIRDYSVIDSR